VRVYAVHLEPSFGLITWEAAMSARIVAIALLVCMLVALPSLAGCSADDDSDSNTQEAVPAGDAAQDAVDELNEKIGESTEDPE
jgi:ABC-type oligopeptide transport system substrate-binding subunit